MILGPDALVTFDGEVVELFGSFGSVSSMRFHMSNVNISPKEPARKGVRDANFSAGNNIAIMRVPDECWPKFEGLMSEITAAKAAWQSGP